MKRSTLIAGCLAGILSSAFAQDTAGQNNNNQTGMSNQNMGWTDRSDRDIARMAIQNYLRAGDAVCVTQFLMDLPTNQANVVMKAIANAARNGRESAMLMSGGANSGMRPTSTSGTSGSATTTGTTNTGTTDSTAMGGATQSDMNTRGNRNQDMNMERTGDMHEPRFMGESLILGSHLINRSQPILGRVILDKSGYDALTEGLSANERSIFAMVLRHATWRDARAIVQIGSRSQDMRWNRSWASMDGSR